MLKSPLADFFFAMLLLPSIKKFLIWWTADFDGDEVASGLSRPLTGRPLTARQKFTEYLPWKLLSNVTAAGHTLRTASIGGNCHLPLLIHRLTESWQISFWRIEGKTILLNVLQKFYRLQQDRYEPLSSLQALNRLSFDKFCS